ncbi:MAG TPA: GH92 family glycosyl hydrolase [Acidimicrobiales bacterium]|jgi:predicted alpha-1,2-mannosidase|nr:GH92 family glycosyl hydrolase [Acidimicrobiales bacterium]
MSATALILVAGVIVLGPGAAPAAASHVPPLIPDPSRLVNPIDGTGTGPVSPGTVGEFPGADVPFGMMQWSPDTTPNAAGAGGGYSYADSQISGFSLTHLSGTGCAAYGDVPILPTVGPIGGNPELASDSFSHAREHASPGRYRVTLGPAPVQTELSVTTRTGLSRFSFPHTSEANVLFKVAGSANPVSRSSFQLSGHDEITGQVTSGQFCGTGTNYTLYFVARFNRSFSVAGAWLGSVVSPGRTQCRGATCGAYVTFNADADPVVLMKVGVSFVSVHDAADNLKAEDPGWSLSHVESQATSKWNQLLGRVGVGGGTAAQQRTLYTALYHSLLHPNVVSDDNGAYSGADGKVHRSTTRSQYANFSEWDIYRSEVELESVVAPHQVGDMIQSLVNDADQGGWLPKWAIVAGDASQMNGDSADPIIAAAYAFGIRNFDVRNALKAMVKGATRDETGHGLEIERQYLSQYLTQHYVNAASLDLTSIDYSIGGSVTLEYALDDFSIAQLALSQGDRSLYATMMARAHNWEYLFNPSTGYLQARTTGGSFAPGPAFSFSQLEPGGQTGFEEGNGIQYTWSVPQDLSALASLMGGNGQAVAKLNSFFTTLNASRDFPYDWAGNEPSLGTPWEYDYFGAPSQTQSVVRRIVDTLYSDTPANEPGNDDLGALSSWYVWAAIGLYPVTPGSADLALGSPLFPLVDLTLPDGRHLTLHAPAASASTPFIHSLRARGIAAPKTAATCGTGAASSEPPPGSGWTRPWLPASVITSGGTLTYGLAKTPDPAWGSSAADRPPSFATGRLPAVGYSFPSGGTTIQVGQPATVQLGLRQAAAGTSTVDWSASSADGLVAAPSSGVFTVHSTACGPAGQTAQSLTVTAATAGAHVLTVQLHTSDGRTLPPVVLTVQAS